jgi:hypothetical protein
MEETCKVPVKSGEMIWVPEFVGSITPNPLPCPHHCADPQDQRRDAYLKEDGYEVKRYHE